MKIFLTGGTGFIGSYVTKLLSDNGHDVAVLVRNPDKVPGLKELPGITLIKGQLTDFEIIKEHLQGKDTCVHIALGWGDTAVDMLKNDTLPSVFLMEESGKAGIKNFIYTSSTASIGHINKKINEETKTKPIDYYGATKSSCENYLFAVSSNHDMKCNIVRPGYTFGNPVIQGACTQPDRRFEEIVKNAKNNKNIVLTKYDGTQFIWAGDLAKIYLSILNSDENREIFFGLGAEFETWEYIAKEAINITGSKSKIILEDKGYSEKPFIFGVGKIEKFFNLNFKTKEKLKEHIEYLIRLK